MSNGSPERPAKRAKIENHDFGNEAKTASLKGTQGTREGERGHSGKHQGKKRGRPYVIFSASGIHSNDVGIMVTSDKGKERQCAQDLIDLLNEHIDVAEGETNISADKNQTQDSEDPFDIEADIHAELQSLAAQPSKTSNATPSQKLTVVSLDIPCVTFVRFPTAKSTDHKLDPVEIVRTLCTSAADVNFKGPRSRYIKRLTPITLVRKTLNDGLESLCEEVLPEHFRIGGDGSDTQEPEQTSTPQSTTKSYKFAIRPSIRNNNKLDRDQVIQTVAQKIGLLGKNMHTVDLKHYDKLVLVDIYRNIVGMSVVGPEFETLKRFNLAELHASHFVEKAKDKGNKSR
ncbi:hypothetical protein B0A52_00547 [Exophiala mesophila]|uniref:THUMP domain-containing protein n=1 Tax=Exophiala mesophila TaxID=212818 RepID=A0A438NHI6_EXOME|nr:hypothetical protein B0A52_00547 [Exophiala mesophila]